MVKSAQSPSKLLKAVSFGSLSISEAGDGAHIVIAMSEDEVTLDREEWRELSTEVSYAFRWTKDQDPKDEPGKVEGKLSPFHVLAAFTEPQSQG